MSVPKVLLIGSLLLFSGIGVLGISKKFREKGDFASENLEKSLPLRSFAKEEARRIFQDETPLPLPSIDRVWQLFTTGPSKLPIVETVNYTSSVSWLEGRPAWLGDYAAYYSTSKHFISRGLVGEREYFTQLVTPGSSFNVFSRDKEIEFHLVVDAAHCRMAFYYIDLHTRERVLLKVYPVGLGRLSEESLSGTLTPYGSYQLGDKVAVYHPGITDLFHDQKTEMVRVFGSRWIPFGQEIGGCAEPAKGYGIQGAPWVFNEEKGALTERRECVGQYESDGCIRLYQEDVEELYSIIITKPTFIHISKHLDHVKLPGTEVAVPSR